MLVLTVLFVICVTFFVAAVVLRWLIDYWPQQLPHSFCNYMQKRRTTLNLVEAGSLVGTVVVFIMMAFAAVVREDNASRNREVQMRLTDEQGEVKIASRRPAEAIVGENMTDDYIRKGVVSQTQYILRQR